MTTIAEPIGTFGRLQAYPTPVTAHEPTWTAPIADLPGFVALIVLSDQHGPSVILSLWRSREDADLLDERQPTAIPTALEDRVYELDDTLTGPAPGPPTAAFLGRFNGPLSPPQIAAARRRGTRSIGPLLAQVQGLVRVLVFWHPVERSMVVIHLAETTEALRQVSKVVAETPLGPEDDPALLPGPDRVGLHQVDHYSWLAALQDPGRPS